MHEATQRRLLRAAFLVLCAVPTLGVLGWAIAWSLPRHAAGLENRLRDRLGMIVRFDRVTHLRPGSLRLDGVQLFDPETRQRLADIASVHVTRTTEQLRLSGVQAAVPLQQSERFWKLLHDRVFGQDLLKGCAATLACDELVVESVGQSYLLHQLSGSIRYDQTALCAEFLARLQDPQTESPLQVTVRRVRNTLPPQTQILVDTQSQFVPLHSLPVAVTQQLGNHCRFNGKLSIARTETSWTCQVTGQLKDVNLKSFLADESPYHLTVTTDIELSDAQFGPHGLDHAAGRCLAGEGSVGRALLQSLVGHHFGSAGPALVAAGADIDVIPFRQLALDWRLDDRGLALRGTCQTSGSSDATSGVAMMGDEGPLWTGPWHPAVHAEYLIRALVPPDLENATELARRLQRRLPRSAPTLDRPTGDR